MWEDLSERYGRPVRRFRAAISAGAMALAWARQENAPAGAAVVAEREVSPLDRLAGLWRVPADATLAAAVVLRPTLPAAQADAIWLLGGLASARAAERASGRPISTWWPDMVVDTASHQTVASIKAEIQLGPGQVRSAVVTVRFDLAGLGLSANGPDRSLADRLLQELLDCFDTAIAEMASEVASVGRSYTERCALVGERVKLRLRPKGEARGIARGVDEVARLELESTTGMVERVTIDLVRSLDTA